MEVTLLCFWFIFCCAIAAWAGNWGRSTAAYFFGSLLCSPLLGAICLLVEGKNVGAVEQKQLVSSEMKKCPYCAELIRPEAIKCRYCGSELPAESGT
jgi:hypothetical protein